MTRIIIDDVEDIEDLTNAITGPVVSCDESGRWPEL